jgi:hypothetical protein
MYSWEQIAMRITVTYGENYQHNQNSKEVFIKSHIPTQEIADSSTPVLFKCILTT